MCLSNLTSQQSREIGISSRQHFTAIYINGQSVATLTTRHRKVIFLQCTTSSLSLGHRYSHAPRQASIQFSIAVQTRVSQSVSKLVVRSFFLLGTISSTHVNYATLSAVNRHTMHSRGLFHYLYLLFCSTRRSLIGGIETTNKFYFVFITCKIQKSFQF